MAAEKLLSKWQQFYDNCWRYWFPLKKYCQHILYSSTREPSHWATDLRSTGGITQYTWTQISPAVVIQLMHLKLGSFEGQCLKIWYEISQSLSCYLLKKIPLPQLYCFSWQLVTKVTECMWCILKGRSTYSAIYAHIYWIFTPTVGPRLFHHTGVRVMIILYCRQRWMFWIQIWMCWWIKIPQFNHPLSKNWYSNSPIYFLLYSNCPKLLFLSH